MVLLALRAQELAARADDRAALGGVERVGEHQAAIVDLAIRVFKAFAVFGLQRGAGGVLAQVEH